MIGKHVSCNEKKAFGETMSKERTAYSQHFPCTPIEISYFEHFQWSMALVFTAY